jgi:hypothetical protein
MLKTKTKHFRKLFYKKQKEWQESYAETVGRHSSWRQVKLITGVYKKCERRSLRKTADSDLRSEAESLASQFPAIHNDTTLRHEDTEPTMRDRLNEQDFSFQAGYAVNPCVIEAAIYKPPLLSSPEYDKIAVGLLRNLWNLSRSRAHIMALINSSICLGFCPAVIKLGKIKPLPRPN